MKEGTFVLCAPSWAGSTLLSYLLGGHSKITSSGGLLWLFSHLAMEDPSHPVYKMDLLSYVSKGSRHHKQGKLHPMWDSVTLCPMKGLYTSVRKQLGTSWLSDSSKNTTWTQAMIEAQPNEPAIFVLMHKTPWGSASSGARHVDKVPTVNDIDIGRIPHWAMSWKQNYNSWRNLFEKYPHIPVVNLPYENLAGNPAGAIRHLLSGTNLSFEPRMMHWAERERHQIGGNYFVHQQAMGGKQEVGIDPKIYEATAETIGRFLEVPGITEVLEWLGRCPCCGSPRPSTAAD